MPLLYKMLVRLLFLVLLLLSTYALKASGPYNSIEVHTELMQLEWSPNRVAVQENKRAVAAILALALGPFGGHRLYMGTKPGVPIVYVATLGGGFFILPLIDLGHILFSKDLSRFQNNDSVFMWRIRENTTQQ